MRFVAKAILAVTASWLLCSAPLPAAELLEDAILRPIIVLNAAQPDQRVIDYLRKLSLRANYLWKQGGRKEAEPVLVRFQNGKCHFYLSRHFSDVKVDPFGARLMDAALHDVPPPEYVSFLATFAFYRAYDDSQPEESVDQWCPEELRDKNFRILVREDEFSDYSLGTLRIEKSSGSAKVDAQALAAIRRANKMNMVPLRVPFAYCREEFVYFGTLAKLPRQRIYEVGLAAPHGIYCRWKSRDYSRMAFHERPFVVPAHDDQSVFY